MVYVTVIHLAPFQPFRFNVVPFVCIPFGRLALYPGGGKLLPPLSHKIHCI